MADLDRHVPGGFSYHRMVVAYHGCDRAVRDAVLLGHDRLRPSENAFDWLGRGIYFWENGPQRALEFAIEQQQRGIGNIREPAVIGAHLQLGRCFDLLDTQFTARLRNEYVKFIQFMEWQKLSLPENRRASPQDRDRLLRHLDCAVVNWAMEQFDRQLVETEKRLYYSSVRGAFTEGDPVYPGSDIQFKTHIQIAVRDADCIIGYFRPIMEEERA